VTYLLSIFVSLSAFALPPANPLTVTGVTLHVDKVQPGARFPVTVNLELPAEFHAYEDKFKINPLAPDGTQVGDTVLKSPRTFKDYSGQTHKGLEDKGELEFFVDLPKQVAEGDQTLKFELEYVACTIKYCLPKNVVAFASHVMIETANAANPSVNTAESKAFVLDDKLENNLFLAFLLVFAFGFLTALTPCVYPLIPITLAVIGARAANENKGKAFSLSLVYVLGIAMTYSILGVIAAQTGALFGSALSYPPVIIFFAVLFFIMGLSLFGLFEIRVPHFITNRLSNSPSGTGYVGAFVSGLVAGVIASPCVGPVLVSVLTYIAKSQNTILGFTLLFTFAMGLGIPFIVLGTSSSLLKKIPKSGGWMNIIKYALGVMMILLGIYYLKPLLKTHGDAQTQTASASRVPLKNGWKLYSKDLLEQAKKDGKPVMIDFFADWCGACVELDKDSFSKQVFIDASKDFVLLKVDATESYPELAELQKTYEVYGLPTVAFINKRGDLLKDLTLTGFEEPEKIIQRMDKAKN